jgi:FixJ family two-component response regulator
MKSAKNSKIKIMSEHAINNNGHIVYIVDDDVSVCKSLGLLLKSHGFRVEIFTLAKDFLNFKHPKLPSCLLLDIELPDINGLELQDKMVARGLHIPTIFITGHGDIPMSVKAIKTGAIDFLPKPFNVKQLLNTIKLAISKNKTQNKEHSEITQIKRHVKTLSPRELEVFHLVAKGLMNKEIAYKMGTVLQTIKVQRGRVMQKMQAKTVTELIHLAHRAGITSIL